MIRIKMKIEVYDFGGDKDMQGYNVIAVFDSSA